MKEYVSLVPDQPSPPENSYLNVIILGIDSTSALNFHRHFPRTFPNIFSFLTGHPSEDYWNEHNKSNVYFDDADLIWKHYKNEGYNTMYLEDMTNYGTFNWYKKLGFKKKPVDHYFRPMAIALENAPIKENKENCFKSKMEGEFYWDYLKMFSSYSKTRILHSPLYLD
ncbi:hypothetical protein LAZ67_5003001 [Cordylochernes scorpioides]|uniref:Sulfotransferase n=1 Tax=Cordylochernes scorpioides TaxID=51811 RepID=A0ABY6KGY1_9ARAC|nr:hypothetical protein LAZ67_5003001 [Cordylochernes scorpioides]